MLDRQSTDCIEDEACEEIRREADEIAGSFQSVYMMPAYTNPSNPDHGDL